MAHKSNVFEMKTTYVGPRTKPVVVLGLSNDLWTAAPKISSTNWMPSGWRRSAKVSGVVNRNLLFIHRRWHRNRGKCHKLSQNINIEPRNECHISCTLCSGIGLHNAGPVELWLQRYEAEIPSRPWRVVIFHILLGWNIVASSASGEVCQKLETATISRWVILLVMPFWGLPYAYWPKIYSAIRNYGLPFAFPWCYLFN